MRTTRRRGLTLLDLLAALAVLAILAGLFFPAVQMARESAKRTESFNNLKYLGLATHNHNDVIGHLPAGCDANNYSAHAHLLPYLEQEALHRQLPINLPVEKAPEAVRKTRVKLFLSPRDPVASVTEQSAPTNYVFCAGSAPALKDNNGVFGLHSRNTIQGIPDGSSNTVLAAETLKGDGGTKPVTVQRQHVRLKAADLEGSKDDGGADWKAAKNVVGDRCASWLDGRFLQTTFTGTLKPNDDRPDVDFGGAGGFSAVRSPDDRILILMGDGSARSVSARKTSLRVWQLACDRQDGQVFSFDE